MKCPFCNSDKIKVYCGRDIERAYLRYRRCLNCYKTFKTVESLSEKAKKIMEA